MELKIAELAQNRNTYLLHVQAFISDYVVMTLSRLDVNRVLLPTLFGLRVWSRGLGLSIPSRVSPLILHTHAESGAYLWDYTAPPRFLLRFPLEPQCAIGLVPSLSGHAIALPMPFSTESPPEQGQ